MTDAVVVELVAVVSCDELRDHGEMGRREEVRSLDWASCRSRSVRGVTPT